MRAMAFVLVMGLMAGSAWAEAVWWDFEWDGSVDPTTANPAWEASGAITGSTDGDVWSQRPGSKWDGYRLSDDLGTWQVADAEGTTVEVRFRYIQGVDGLIGAWGPRQWQGVLQAGPIFTASGDGGQGTALDTEWNIVRYLMSSDGNNMAWVLPGGGDWPASALDNPSFPAWTGSGAGASDVWYWLGGDLDIDYVRWTFDGLIQPVPEPAGLALLAMSGLAMLRRRRR